MITTPKSIRLLIADDQPTILRGLALMLGSEEDVEIVGLAKDGVEAVDMANKLVPDVVLMDLKMPRMTGLEATRAILRTNSAVKIVVLTTFDSDELKNEAISAGAHTFLLKDDDEQNVLATIRAVQEKN